MDRVAGARGDRRALRSAGFGITWAVGLRVPGKERERLFRISRLKTTPKYLPRYNRSATFCIAFVEGWLELLF